MVDHKNWALIKKEQVGGRCVCRGGVRERQKERERETERERDGKRREY